MSQKVESKTAESVEERLAKERAASAALMGAVADAPAGGQASPGPASLAPASAEQAGHEQPGHEQRSPRQRMETPLETQPLKLDWRYAIPITLVHVIALLAFLPTYWHWGYLVLMLASLYTYNTLGINLCYHRLLTHQGFTCPKWFERFLAFQGVCCLEDTPTRWVAIHRLHHQHSDEQADPHSPWVSFFWGHMGWLLFEHREHKNVLAYERYVRDLLRDPFYLTLERNYLWALIYLGHALVFFLAGWGVGWWWTSHLAHGASIGAGVMLWGVFVRTVVGWHITWSVNSVTHLWGYRNYETSDDSRNNVLIGLLSNGEGWHNNHHYDQRCARHGLRWWEFDVTWLTILALEAVGMVKNVVRPKDQRKKAAT